ncbi:uncharacterized protein VTP21DRAFT_8156 [Calcarisporiella thermophila]|uniref:uncharacterized protein n=1 Tax=Calcarisporiella thermophila TaxID=911321 RepID=UPI0037427D01
MILILLAIFSCVLGETLLTLDYGVFNGTIENGLSVWRGVPFAEPPVGNLRFRAPRPPQPFTSVQQADKFGKSCIQFKEIRVYTSGLNETSEDCLYLNIWKPENSQNLPILFWIYGGSFLGSSPSMDLYDGSRLVQHSNNSMIFVSANYRLGPLGFLSSEEVREDGDLNAGLLDQRMALEWVRRYAQAFGGDPTRVTVMGESAGAVSIGFHLFSSTSKNETQSNTDMTLESRQRTTMQTLPQLPFDRAILSSGSPTSMYHCPSYRVYQSVYNELVKRVECSNASNTLDCLRNCDISLLRDVGKAMAKSMPLIFTFVPVVDGKYIAEGCAKLMSNQKLFRIPIIVGTNTNEGTGFTHDLPSNTTEKFYAAINQMVPCASNSSLQDIARLYPEEAAIPKYETRASMVFGDMLFTCPALELAKAYTPEVYKYRFNQALGIFGATHGYDLLYTFLNTTGMSSAEVQLANTMTDYYISFVKSGDPNTNTSHIKWPTYAAGEQIIFEAENVVLEKDLSDNEKCIFWSSFNNACSLFK